jgi:hypothetical protein
VRFISNTNICYITSLRAGLRIYEEKTHVVKKASHRRTDETAKGNTRVSAVWRELSYKIGMKYMSLSGIKPISIPRRRINK